MPRNAGRATPMDMMMQLASGRECVTRVVATVPDHPDSVAAFRVREGGQFKAKMEEWRTPTGYSSGLRNLLQRHFKKVSAGEWFSSGTVLVPAAEAESLERTWGRSTRQPHPNWDNVLWEDVQEEQEKGSETGQAAAVAPEERLPSPQPSAHVPTPQAPRRADESHQRPVVASDGVVSGAAAGSAGGSGKEPASADHTPSVGTMGEAASVAVVSEQALKEGAASTGSVSGHKRCRVEISVAEEAHDLALDHSGNR